MLIYDDIKPIISQKEKQSKPLSGLKATQSPLIVVDEDHQSSQKLKESYPTLKKMLSSQNTLSLLKSKLAILDSTLIIINEQLESLKLSSSYATKVKDRIKTVQYENDLMNFKTDYIAKQSKKQAPVLKQRRPFVLISEENVLKRMDSEGASEDGRRGKFTLELQSADSAKLGCSLMLLFIVLTELSASVLQPKDVSLSNSIQLQLKLVVIVALSILCKYGHYKLVMITSSTLQMIPLFLDSQQPLANLHLPLVVLSHVTRVSSHFLALSYFSQYCPLDKLYTYLSLTFTLSHLSILGSIEVLQRNLLEQLLGGAQLLFILLIIFAFSTQGQYRNSEVYTCKLPMRHLDDYIDQREPTLWQYMSGVAFNVVLTIYGIISAKSGNTDEQITVTQQTNIYTQLSILAFALIAIPFVTKRWNERRIVICLMVFWALLDIKHQLFPLQDLALSSLSAYLIKYSLCYPQSTYSAAFNPVTLITLYSLTQFSGVQMPQIAGIVVSCACVVMVAGVYGQLRVRYERRQAPLEENNGYKLLL
ncbi:hypothetical protein FGO68_gene8963 [Halteria grandinella]|uniref:Uncharacterized protein n=1 Tax=Halteria grandinella TaxID=5974 RepID=A0A8J8T6A7_HALGN|nr:hypothetical protein FGO68_gene8963 [Halteria grandinella]